MYNGIYKKIVLFKWCCAEYFGIRKCVNSLIWRHLLGLALSSETDNKKHCCWRRFSEDRLLLGSNCWPSFRQKTTLPLHRCGDSRTGLYLSDSAGLRVSSSLVGLIVNVNVLFWCSQHWWICRTGVLSMIHSFNFKTSLICLDEYCDVWLGNSVS